MYKSSDDEETSDTLDESVTQYASDVLDQYFDTSAYSTSYDFNDDESEEIPSWPIPYSDDSECGRILNDLTAWFSYIYEDGVPEFDQS